MEITGRYIRNLDRHLRAVPAGTDVVIALDEIAAHRDRLREIGFSDGLPLGQAILPEPVGKRSTYNAEGEYIVHKDQPMETRYRQVEWTWEEFHGPYDRVQRSRIVDVPYKAYPRTFRPPPSIELTIAEAATGAKTVVAPVVRYDDANREALLHLVNLFLELFGHAVLLTEDLEPYLSTEVRRYNWDVLPPGKMPWPRLRERVRPILDDFGEGFRPVAEHRLKTFTETYPSSFTAVGRAGFRGYLIFGYGQRGIYVVESLYYGNATYVFGEDWERLSQMTKAEILSADLQEDRIIHNEDWDGAIAQLLG